MYACMQKTIKPFVNHTKNGHRSSCSIKGYKYFPWSYPSWIQYITGKHNPRCVWRLSPSHFSINIKISARTQSPDITKFRLCATFQANNLTQTLKLSRCCTLIHSTCRRLTVFTSQTSTFPPFHIYHKNEQHSLQGFRAVNIFSPLCI